MSQTNSPGGEDDGRDPIAEDFEFYFPFAKTLALDLPTPEDTSIAAAWVQKLETEPESEEEKRTRLEYLKLLLFVLQRGRLIGMFRKQPPSGALQPLPQGLSVLDMGNLMLDQDDTPTCGEGDARCLPYTIEISNDLREFVASQEIPNFGVQMYYAWSSDEPVHKWLCFDEEKFPQFVLEKIKQLKEVKSDEKSTVVKNGCLAPKTGCDLPLIEKCAKKKVKSPQEIEKSQGRSFHTYVGLVGRMGNFSDKCGDDPDKCQRQDPRRGKGVRRNLQKEYSGSGGEAAEEMSAEDDLASFLSGAGGLNSLNRPCLCPVLGGHPHYPEHSGKGGPQHFQEQQSPRMNYTFPIGDRKQMDSSVWSTGESEALNEDECPERITPLRNQSQRRSPSPRMKSISPNRPNADCPPQDDVEFYKRDAVCCCTSPPCTCPCPRAVPQGPMRKTPSSMNASAGGRVPADPNITAKQGACVRMNREDPCAATPQGPDPGPSGAGRSGGSPRPRSRTKSPQIIHCYDSQNPDPCLTQTISGLDSLNWSDEIGSNAFLSDSFDSPSQGEAYDPCQQPARAHSPTCAPVPGTKQKSDRYSPPVGQRSRSPRTPSPQPAPRPVRQVPQEPPQQCRPNQQPAQSYQECAAPTQVRPASANVCGRPAADSRRTPPQPRNDPENIYAFLDKFPPECPGFTPPSFENVFARPAADSCSPDSPQWNQPEYLYDFLDKFSQNAPGRNAPGTDNACARPAADPCRPPPQTGNQPEDLYAFLEKNFPPSAPAPAPASGRLSQMYPGLSDVFRRPAAEPCRPPPQTGNQPEDLYAFLEKNFPPKAPTSAPSGMTGRPSQMYPGLSDVFRRPAADPCRPPSQPGNQRQNVGAFLENFPPNAPAPAPAVLTGKPGRMRPGMNEVCGKPAADPCRPPPQTGNQPEDMYAFLEKNFPPSTPAPAAPGRKSPRMANMSSLLQGINQRREAHREKCDQMGSKKLPASDAGFCRPSSQPPANVCPEQGLPGGGAMPPNYCAEFRPPTAPVCPDAGNFRRQPVPTPKSANVDICAGGPPSRGKTTTFMGQQPNQFRQPMPSAYGAGEKACDDDQEEGDECESSESAGEECAKEPVPTRTQQQQQPCANVWSGVQSGSSQRPNAGRETSRPNREAEMQSCAPQRVTSGKAPQQEQRTYRAGEVQSSAPKRISPGKTYRQEAAVYREPSMQTGSQRKGSPGKAAEECNEDWGEMPQPASQMGRPGKLSQQESNAVECLGMQGGAAQVPTAGGSFRKESRKSKEPDVQSCPPQNLDPGKAVNRNLSPGDWSELASRFSENTSSRGSRKNDETPTWYPLVWGRKPPETEGPRPQEANVQSYNPSQRKSPGRPSSQEGTQSCAQPVNTARRTSPRKGPQQISFKDDDGATASCSQAHQNMLQECVQFLRQNFGGNPYMENSLRYYKSRHPLAKTSSPNDWLESGQQNSSPTATTISNYETQCEYNNLNEQMEFCEDEDDSGEYLPLYSINTDLSTTEFFSLPQRTPRNEQCPQQAFDPNCAFEHPRDMPHDVSFQAFQDDDTLGFCDSPENGFY